MIIKLVDKKSEYIHFLLSSGKSKLLPKDAVYHWNQWWGGSADEVDGAAVAYHKGKLVGFFRYNVKAFWAAGTWVDKSFRNKGLALKLWKAALRKESPKTVHVCTTTRGGKALVSSVKKVFPKIRFVHDFCYY
jgi:hypothetical protein